MESFKIINNTEVTAKELENLQIAKIKYLILSHHQRKSDEYYRLYTQYSASIHTKLKTLDYKTLCSVQQIIHTDMDKLKTPEQYKIFDRLDLQIDFYLRKKYTKIKKNNNKKMEQL